MVRRVGITLNSHWKVQIGDRGAVDQLVSVSDATLALKVEFKPSERIWGGRNMEMRINMELMAVAKILKWSETATSL